MNQDFGKVVFEKWQGRGGGRMKLWYSVLMDCVSQHLSMSTLDSKYRFYTKHEENNRLEGYSYYRGWRHYTGCKYRRQTRDSPDGRHRDFSPEHRLDS
jgi:hypothetical protein